MLYAVKGNKQLKIEEAEKDTYLKLGYDIAKADEGSLETIETSPSKTVTWKEHQEIIAENAILKEQLAAAAADPVKSETLEKENKSLKEKLAEANKKLKEITKE